VRFRGNKKVIDANMVVVELAMDSVPGAARGAARLEPSSLDVEEMLSASGNDVVGMAKIVGGVRYQAYYPITPASDEFSTATKFWSRKAAASSPSSKTRFLSRTTGRGLWREPST